MLNDSFFSVVFLSSRTTLHANHSISYHNNINHLKNKGTLITRKSCHQTPIRFNRTQNGKSPYNIRHFGNHLSISPRSKRPFAHQNKPNQRAHFLNDPFSGRVSRQKVTWLPPSLPRASSNFHTRGHIACIRHTTTTTVSTISPKYCPNMINKITNIYPNFVLHNQSSPTITESYIWHMILHIDPLIFSAAKITHAITSTHWKHAFSSDKIISIAQQDVFSVSKISYVDKASYFTTKLPDY